MDRSSLVRSGVPRSLGPMNITSEAELGKERSLSEDPRLLLNQPGCAEVPALTRLTERPMSAFQISVLVPVYNERHLVEGCLRRLLSLRHELIAGMEVIVADDHSSDGTWEVLQRVAGEDSRLVLCRHDHNRGKGAAIRTALQLARGEISIIQDADFEYNPADIPALLLPFATEGADAVFGSRYLTSTYRRALMHRHTLVNKGLTFLGNWFTDLNITDLETGYKAISTTLLKSIPLRSDDFSFEVEVVFKLAKRGARTFEVPIRYLPRTRQEGKKMRFRDGLRAIGAMLRYSIIDDIYQEDEYGSHILHRLEGARRFNTWMGDTIRPFIGDRVLELGAGIGSLTNQFIPRQRYLASDVNPNYLRYLRAYQVGKPYLQVSKIDATNPRHFAGLENQFDTVLLINVLEHLSDRHQTLINIQRSLQHGGRLIVLVPQNQAIYGTLDHVLGHELRYTKQGLQEELTNAGFTIETMFDFNRVSVAGWWLNGKVLRRSKLSRAQLKALEIAMPVVRVTDRFCPWHGLSVVAVATRS